MFAWLARLPLLVSLIGLGGLAMLLPAAHAAATGERQIAEIFFTYGALALLLAGFIGIARAGMPKAEWPGMHLLGLATLFVALPLIFALPFRAAIGNTTLLNAYVEMVSCLTTTGATLFDDPARLAPPLHTWRATVGWLGGLFILVGGIAVLAPMALGGFEVRRRPPSEEVIAFGFTQITERADLARRVRIHAAALTPVYTALTGLVWTALFLAGDRPAVALAHAMSTLSTSGISPTGGLAGTGAGVPGELIIAVFLVFALSRLTFAPEHRPFAALARDPEIRLALAIVTVLPLFLFLRHFLGAYELGGNAMSLGAGLASLWGSVFTVLSFLTTTGWQSEAWAASRHWSGLETPGLILVGLALIGGGVATTAGGAKLLRVAALTRHGVRELERLVHPHWVGGSGGSEARHLRRRGAYLAWLFFMLMAMSVALAMIGFALSGENLEDSLVFTISALTTTGPLARVAEAAPLSYAGLSVAGKYVLAASMVLGRLESLAIIALFNRELWRR